MLMEGAPVLHSLGNVNGFNLLTFGQICNGSCHFQGAVRATTTPAQMVCDLGEVVFGVTAQGHMLVERSPREGLVAAALACLRKLASLVASFFDVRRVFPCAA
jgi:hypothetical protein